MDVLVIKILSVNSFSFEILLEHYVVIKSSYSSFVRPLCSSYEPSGEVPLRSLNIVPREKPICKNCTIRDLSP